jgi:hypothetical protein
MQRVLAAARNVGTDRYPYLTGVEVRIPGSEIDYTVRDRDVQRSVTFDVAVEVKRWGTMRDRETSARTVTVAEQIQQRINTLRNQIESALRNPAYSAVLLEVQGMANVPTEMRSALMDEFSNYHGLATTLNKRFTWRQV